MLPEHVEQDGRRARLPLDREDKIGLAVAPVGLTKPAALALLQTGAAEDVAGRSPSGGREAGDDDVCANVP